jgi:hypothetical protein
MKLVKLALLTVSAVLVAMASIGASSASATPPWIALCDAPQLLNCEKNHLIAHPLLGAFLLLQGSGGGIGNRLQFAYTSFCESAIGKTSEVSSQQKGEFTAKLEGLTFVDCEGCTSMESPSATMILSMETAETESWRLKINNFRIKDSGCPFGIACTFESNLNLKVQMNESGAFVEPEGGKFTFVEGSPLCGTSFKWETGRTTFDWKLDDGTIHKNIWPSLIAELTPRESVKL